MQHVAVEAFVVFVAVVGVVAGGWVRGEAVSAGATPPEVAGAGDGGVVCV